MLPTVRPIRFYTFVLWSLFISVLWWYPSVGKISSCFLVVTLPCPLMSCPVLCSALSVWMEQCASTASLLASVREQERQFEMLSRALEEERRSCAGTLPRPLPAMQVTLNKPRPIHLPIHTFSIGMSPGLSQGPTSPIVNPYPSLSTGLDGRRPSTKPRGTNASSVSF